MPLVADVTKLQSEIAAAGAEIDATRFGTAAIIEQEKRYVELVNASTAVAHEVAERSRQMQALAEELARSAKVKDEMIAEPIASGPRRDTTSQVRRRGSLLRAKGMPAARGARSGVAFGEKKLAAVETRLTDMKQLATELDKSIAAIAAREQLVNAIKSEVESVHEISARSRADLQHVTEHRGEVATLKHQVDVLLSRIAETDERIVAIDAKRKLVDEVQTKANAIVHVLDDVRLNLETLGEQKAVVDHVAEKVAQLEFMLQEARNTLRTLQHERELAERIEMGIKQLRSKTAKNEDASKTA